MINDTNSITGRTLAPVSCAELKSFRAYHNVWNTFRFIRRKINWWYCNIMISHQQEITIILEIIQKVLSSVILRGEWQRFHSVELFLIWYLLLITVVFGSFIQFHVFLLITTPNTTIQNQAQFMDRVFFALHLIQ